MQRSTLKMFNGKLNRVQVDPALQNRVNAYNKYDGWSSKCNAVLEFKATIKPILIKNQSGLCAYCGLEFNDGARQVHMDHIANKADHTTVIYNPDNLVCSCPRCNMDFKLDVETVTNCTSSDYSKWEFNIVHPYFDDPADFFEYDYITPGFIRNKKGINDVNRRKAINTIRLFELDSDYLLSKRKEKMFYNSVPKSISDIIIKISRYKRR